VAGRYAKLTRDWVLRGWRDAPWVVANRVTGDVRNLRQKSFYVAECCNGTTNFNSLAFLPEHHALLDLLIQEGIAEECRSGDGTQPHQRFREADNPRLTEVHWCVTGRCNLKCRHCYMESTSGRYGELPFSEMARLVDQFVQANVLQVSLTGGEPFIRKDLIDLIELLSKKQLWLSYIYSNGLLVTDEHLLAIRRLGFAPNFQISFDGVGAHDQMRGVDGVESKVIQAIQRVRSFGFPVIISTSIDQINIDQLIATYSLLKDLGVQSWRIGMLRKAGNWKGATAAGTDLSAVAKACSEVLDCWLNDGKPFYLQLAGFYDGGPSLSTADATTGCDTFTDCVRKTAGYKPHHYDCIACREQPNLLPDGTLLPCPGYVDSVLQERMPNLLVEDLSAVWSRSFVREIVDIKKQDLLAKNPQCAVCELFEVCGLGCRASAVSETGDLMAKDPISCEVWKNGYKKRFERIALRNNGSESDCF
jgi:radical SAM protein with 4Fe4S-binding SPASM domain